MQAVHQLVHPVVVNAIQEMKTACAEASPAIPTSSDGSGRRGRLTIDMANRQVDENISAPQRSVAVGKPLPESSLHLRQRRTRHEDSLFTGPVELLITPSAARETRKRLPNMGFDSKCRAKRTIFSVS
jgi:hypothetical protein